MVLTRFSLSDPSYPLLLPASYQSVPIQRSEETAIAYDHLGFTENGMTGGELFVASRAAGAFAR